MVRELWIGLAVTALLAGDAGASQPAALAEVNGRGTAVDWTVLTPYQRAVLTVSMPDGEVVRSEVGAGTPPTFIAFDDNGEAHPDGSYNWELRLDPIVAPDVQRRLAAALSRGDERAVRRIRRDHGLERELVQSGSFALSGGVFVAHHETEPDPPAPAKLRPATAADQVVNDDLIVRGNACVGAACANGMFFPAGPLVVRDKLSTIFFDDTSSSTEHDWAIYVNAGPVVRQGFSVVDYTSGTLPFTISARAPTSSIFVDSGGSVGLGTSTPAAALHIKNLAPYIRLESTRRAWNIEGDSLFFGISDVNTGGGLHSFKIMAGAPPTSLHIDSDGAVGMGTFDPHVDLHVHGANTADTAIGIGPNPDGSLPGQSALNIAYAGLTSGRGAGLFNVRPDSGATPPNPSLRFLTADVERMILDNEGFLGLGGVPDPANPIEHSSGAVLTAGGTWQSVSSRATKRDIRPLEASAALAALAGLEPVRFYYQAEPDDEYVGFVAEDVPDLVATTDHKRLGPLDIVAVLTKVAQQQQATIDELRAHLGELAARVAAEDPTCSVNH
jgi:hypothetical protein